ncbi:NAD(P)-binding domain-containing protein [Polaromonas sp. P1-6]|nr:NAD(P)-binding domain-containing protein [Polaromonas sp. P1-6]
MDTNYTTTPSIVFIGGGQMASAIIAGLVRTSSNGSHILVVEPVETQRELLASRYGVHTSAVANERIEQAEIVVWAVKPQIFREAASAALAHLGGALHVSIAAGIPIEALCALLQTRRVVRVMPNTSALVGAGVTGMTASKELSHADRAGRSVAVRDWTQLLGRGRRTLGCGDRGKRERPCLCVPFPGSLSIGH